MDLPPGVSAHTVTTDRLRTHWIESGPADGVPVVLVHGNLSTGRFYEHLLPGAPDRFRLIAPDMRGFGRSEPLPLDGTRGLRDWSDDVHALVRTLGITDPVHLAGWSTGGAAISHYALDHGGVASLTYIDPVSPFGFGGARPDGTPWAPDWAGSGGGAANPEFVRRLAEGDRSADSPLSPRAVMNATYWRPDFRLPPEREDLLVEEILLSLVGDDGYPGDSTPSSHWPGMAPGTRGILNALSGKYCDWSAVVGLDPKPPVLWVHGDADVVVSDTSALEFGTLGAAGQVPGWPGADVYGLQPMVSQIRDVLTAYRDAGGEVAMHLLPGAGHGPLFDAQEEFSRLFFGHLDRAAR